MKTQSALILGAFILAGFFLTQFSASGQGVPAKTEGRYQATVGGGGNPYLVVVDTATGQCWSTPAATGGGSSWKELGIPGKQGKE